MRPLLLITLAGVACLILVALLHEKDRSPDLDVAPIIAPIIAPTPKPSEPPAPRSTPPPAEATADPGADAMDWRTAAASRPRMPIDASRRGSRGNFGTISGEVVDAEGRPVRSAKVAVVSSWRDDTGRTVTSDPSGGFGMPRVPALHYAGLQACHTSADGIARVGVTDRPFRLAPGGHHDGGVVRLGSATIARGAVTTEDGAPLAGRNVIVRPVGHPRRALTLITAEDGTYALQGEGGPWGPGGEIEIWMCLTPREREDYEVLPAPMQPAAVGATAFFTIAPRILEERGAITFIYTGEALERDHPIRFHVLANERLVFRGESYIDPGENTLPYRIPLAAAGPLSLELISVTGFLRCPLRPEGAFRHRGEGGAWISLMRVTGTLLDEREKPATGVAILAFGHEPRAPRSASGLGNVRGVLDGTPFARPRQELPPRHELPSESSPCDGQGRFELNLPPGAWWLSVQRKVRSTFIENGARLPWRRLVLEDGHVDLGRLVVRHY